MINWRERRRQREEDRVAKAKEFHGRLVAILNEHAPKPITQYRFAWLSPFSNTVMDVGRVFNSVDDVLSYVGHDSALLDEAIVWVETRVIQEWRQV